MTQYVAGKVLSAPPPKFPQPVEIVTSSNTWTKFIQNKMLLQYVTKKESDNI